MKNIAETQFLNSNKNFGLSYHHHRQLSPEDTSSKDVQGVLLKRAISQLEDHLRVTQGILRDTQVEYDRLQATNQQNEARLAMAVEDHEALNFVIAVQNLKIRELEVSISNSRLQHNETLSEKHRKHKSELRRLNRERIEYEARAESMIAQMTEQMNALQTMAMARIEV